MIGSIVGVGIFGLPYVFSQVGYASGLLVLLFLSAIMTGMLFMYSDVVLHTPGQHRFAGNVETYLGKGWSRVATATLAFGFWGSMLAFLVAGGRLLAVLFGLGGPTAETILGLCMVAVVAVLSYRGLRFVARFEVWILGILAFLFLFIVLACLPHVGLSNLSPAVLEKGSLIALYGVVFFALTGGINAIPEMHALLGKRGGSLSYAVFIGMACVTLLYVLFTFTVVGALGDRVTEFAVDALAPLIGGSFRLVGASLAVVCLLSAFMISSIELQNSLRHDNRMKRFPAWALAIGVPVVLYLAGIRSFIGILGFIGAVFTGVNGVLVVMTYERMRSAKVCRDHTCLEVPSWLSYGLIIFYLLGIAATFYSMTFIV